MVCAGWNSNFNRSRAKRRKRLSLTQPHITACFPPLAAAFPGGRKAKSPRPANAAVWPAIARLALRLEFTGVLGSCTFG